MLGIVTLVVPVMLVHRLQVVALVVAVVLVVAMSTRTKHSIFLGLRFIVQRRGYPITYKMTSSDLKVTAQKIKWL